MSLSELSDQYPKSLYLLDINSKEYQLVKGQKDVLLGGAVFSKDKNYLIYDEYVLNNETVIGAAYSGGVYLADRTGNISLIDELKDEGIYLVEKLGDNIYCLYVYDILTGKSIKLAVNTEMIDTNWSPSGKKLSYTEWDGEQYTSSIIYLK